MGRSSTGVEWRGGEDHLHSAGVQASWCGARRRTSCASAACRPSSMARQAALAGFSTCRSNGPKQKLVENTNPREYLFSDEFLENINTGVDPGYYSIVQTKHEGRTTLVRWAFPFSPSKDGCDHFVPFFLSGTSLYVEEQEKLVLN